MVGVLVGVPVSVTVGVLGGVSVAVAVGVLVGLSVGVPVGVLVGQTEVRLKVSIEPLVSVPGLPGHWYWVMMLPVSFCTPIVALGLSESSLVYTTSYFVWPSYRRS